MENLDKNLRKNTAEHELRKRFELQIENLGLTEDHLRQANAILDIGAGERYFAAYCFQRGINKNVYSLDPNIRKSPYDTGFVRKNWPDLCDEIDKKTILGKRENLSFSDNTFDLIINHAAMPGRRARREGNLYTMQSFINMNLNEIIRVLKPGGEARMLPLLTEETTGGKLSEQYYTQHFRNRLNQLKRDDLCNFNFEEFEKNEGNEEKLQKYIRVVIKKK